jgi:hypothetical protein
LIIDSSGSMAAKVDGRQKMAIAKDVVRTSFTGSIPAYARVAVRAYGHRRKDDCSDLELLTPLGAKNGAQITKTIQTLKPVGMTPITAALEAAGQDFAGREGQRNVIILLSDGKETCPGDPCAAARRLHEAGIQVQINVVGFDVTAEERQQLECIATAGGGKYYNADTAKALQGALAELQKQVAPVQAAAAPATPPPQSKTINLLDPKNGGQAVVVPNDAWLETTVFKGDDPAGLEHKSKHGKRARVFPPGEEAIFAFKDERPATFDTFSVLIPNKGNNLKEYELLVADESMAGPFRSVRKCETVNAKVLPKKGYQECSFPAETAKYLKVKLLSGHETDKHKRGMFLYEFRLLGRLE